MDYGAMYIKWAPFAAENPEPAGRLPTYGPAVSLGPLNKVTDNPSFNEAKGYGDNSLQVYVNKFKETVLAVETTELAVDTMSAISGTTIETGTHKNMRFRNTDKAPYGGLGFIVNLLLTGNRDICRGVFYPKVKAMLQGTEYNTNGENLTLATKKLQFTGAACASGDWRIESPDFETEEEAKAWVDGMFTGESTDIGKEEAQPAARSAPAKTAASKETV